MTIIYQCHQSCWLICITLLEEYGLRRARFDWECVDGAGGYGGHVVLSAPPCNISELVQEPGGNGERPVLLPKLNNPGPVQYCLCLTPQILCWL